MSAEKGFLSQIEPHELERKLKRIPLYIRMTSWGKIAIGVMVLVLIAAVVIVPFMKPEDEGMRIALMQSANSNIIVENPIMKNPRFESVDGANQPYTVRAKEAVQQDASHVMLNKINADVALNNGLWIALSAQKGVLNVEQEKLKLNDKVHLIASNGYELRSPSAYVDMKHSRVQSMEGIEGQGPMGNIKSDEFLIEGDSRRVLFEKNVKLTIYP